MLIKNTLNVLRAKLLSPITARLEQIEKSQQSNIGNIDNLKRRLELIQLSLGRIEHRQLLENNSSDLQSHEFQVFSQWGEDGIVQFLISNIEIEKKIFVEFGVEDYKQANTRFLLINNNWSGLVIDGSEENVSRIKSDYVYWNYNLKAVTSFVTKENINSLLKENGLSGEIGLLSIDIDGNDYWVWDSIDVINPTIVVVEYNYRFGHDAVTTIPYDANFERSKTHFSMIYFGASLRALCRLGDQKGYAFVGCCGNGVNSFFVRRDKLPPHIKETKPEDAFVLGNFCEARDENGTQIKLSPQDEIELLNSLGLPLIDLLK
jgi:hypothetical protein